MAIQLVGVALKRAAFAIEVDGFPLKRVDDDRPAWSSELPVPVVALVVVLGLFCLCRGRCSCGHKQ